MNTAITSLTIAVAAVAIIMLVIYGVRQTKQNSTAKKLKSLLQEGKYDELFELANSESTQKLFSDYELAYFKLKAYLREGNEDGARMVLDYLLSMRLPEQQRTDLVVKAFDIYLGWEDADHAFKLLKEIEGWEDEKYAKTKRNCQRMYNIVILNKSDYIDEMKHELGVRQGNEAEWYEYYIALQYRNMGDDENYRKYYGLAVEHGFKPATGQTASASTDDSSESA